MKLNNRIHAMLALLMMGSASLMAQDSDPFGEAQTGLYGNMSMTARVTLDGVPLKENSVLGVFCGNSLRGKAASSEEDSSVFYLSISGNNTGESLYVKLYTQGRIIEAAPEDFTYVHNAVIGKPSEPFVLNLPAPVVTTPTAEGWATTCLPFNAEVPQGVTVWNVTGIANEELVMTKAEGTVLPKDTPVLLQTEGKTSYEWLSRLADGNIAITGSILEGTTEPKVVATNSVMTLGYSVETSEIGFWRYTGTTVPANRAFIANIPSGVRGFALMGGGTNALENVVMPLQPAQQAYDLSGRRVNQQCKVWKKNSQGQLIIIR